MELPEHTRDIIDVADGIDRVMGERRLYARMLVRFRREYSSGAGAIVAALDRGDTTEAHRLTHSLKGAAGMIGALGLHISATAAEHAIRTAMPRMRDYITALDSEFVKVVRLLDVLIDDMVISEAPPRTLLAYPALIARLAELLLEGDGAAVDLINESAASLRTVLGETAFGALSLAINNFDYPHALQLLRNAAHAPSSGNPLP